MGGQVALYCPGSDICLTINQMGCHCLPSLYVCFLSPLFFFNTSLILISISILYHYLPSYISIHLIRLFLLFILVLFSLNLHIQSNFHLKYSIYSHISSLIPFPLHPFLVFIYFYFPNIFLFLLLPFILCSYFHHSLSHEGSITQFKTIRITFHLSGISPPSYLLSERHLTGQIHRHIALPPVRYPIFPPPTPLSGPFATSTIASMSPGRFPATITCYPTLSSLNRHPTLFFGVIKPLFLPGP